MNYNDLMTYIYIYIYFIKLNKQNSGVSNTSVTEIPSNFFKLTNLNIL